MSKGKASKDKSARAAKSTARKTGQGRAGKKERKAKKPGGDPPEGTVTETAVSSAPGVRPPGQRLYDMPYSALAPRLIKPEIGLHNLVTRAGHNAGYTIDVTLLDAPDHRLIRSGVVLAHRVLDGRGEWYLSATEWQPMLPEERIEPMGQADLSEAFADLVRPFRRRATLGPVAALNCERREFALRDDRGNTLALLRDDKVTVRRGGLTTARYREVMLTPTGPGLNEEQQAQVEHALDNAGATQVTKFPRLVTRLGAPATGPTDFPAPQGLDNDTSFTQFVSHLLGARLRQILCADLSVRTDEAGGAAQLAARCSQLRTELHGLSSVIDVSWMEDLDEELEWIVGQAEQDTARHPDALTQQLKYRLRGERYLTLLDRLVTATRAPQVGNVGSIQASEVLGSLVNVGQSAVEKASGRLSADSPREAWTAATDAVEGLFQVTGVASYLLPERVERLRHSLGVTAQLLAEATKHDAAAQRSRDLAATSSVEEAFALGRAYENELAVAHQAREAFVRRWAKTAKKLE